MFRERHWLLLNMSRLLDINKWVWVGGCKYLHFILAIMNQLIRELRRGHAAPWQRKSLAGLFSSKDFVIHLSDCSVSLQHLNLIPCSYLDADKDYSSFVAMVRGIYHSPSCPGDVSSWLSLISKGVNFWQADLLLNHIVMTEEKRLLEHYIAIPQLLRVWACWEDQVQQNAEV